MERRLRLAGSLLNPAASVLIVTIDEKEYLRLGLLLEQTFPSARIQMVSAQINPANSARPGGFARNDEYLYFVMFGAAAPLRLPLDREWVSARGRTFTGKIRWDLLRRSGTGTRRQDSPGGFYPIYVDPDGPKFAAIGEPLPDGVSEPPLLEGAVAVLPIRQDGTEGRWQLSPNKLRAYMSDGRVRIGGSEEKGFTVYYLKPGEYAKITNGEYEVDGRGPDDSLAVGETDSDDVLTVPGTQWRVASHDSTQYGSRLLAKLLPGRKFPFPKSLYAVEDALRFFVADKPEALILDFFAGSGTTAHAVMRLNKQDGGRRRCVIVTNNEVSAEEADDLRKRGLRPGDEAWEALGIANYITKPRIASAVTGRTPSGAPVKGDYKFGGEFAISEGLAQNVEFFDLTYEDVNEVRYALAFEAIAPLLWLKAGSEGRKIMDATKDFDLAEAYGVLFNIDASGPFLAAVAKAEGLRCVFIVTDSDSQYQLVANELPDQVESVRLYEAYLRSVEIAPGMVQ